MDILIACIIGAIAGAAVVVWRLKGGRSVAETVGAVIQGGGPGSTPPPPDSGTGK